MGKNLINKRRQKQNDFERARLKIPFLTVLKNLERVNVGIVTYIINQ
jgi:hypothetical protein